VKLVASLKYQIVDTLKKITVPMIVENNPHRIENEKISIKKHDAKIAMNWIFSYGSYERIRDSLIVFAKIIQEKYKIKNINELDQRMVKYYYKYRKDQKISPWTLHNDYYAVSKLEVAMKKRNWIGEDYRIQVNPRIAKLPKRKLENRIARGPYLEKEVDQIINYIFVKNERIYKIIKYIYISGARIEEALTVKVNHIDIENKIIHFYNTKGKRYRKIIIDNPKDLEFIKNIIKGKKNEDYILPRYSKTYIEKVVREANKELEIVNRKLHGFRAAKAIYLYNQYMTVINDKGKTKKIISKFLGHNRKEVLRFYLNRS
jgi:integrase